MSSLDSDTINEVVIAVASPSEENSIDMRKRKLESLQFQNEVFFFIYIVLIIINKKIKNKKKVDC
jgi:hypothetical protein